jgi:NADPH:quinone reductase-like Zn-dependent oxidoreductase
VGGDRPATRTAGETRGDHLAAAPRFKTLATTVNSGDARVRALRVPAGLRLPMRLKLGFTKPKQPILGFELAGQVEAVGRAVTRFEPGDRVVASRGFDFGGHAELLKPVIDSVLPFEQIVEAHRRVDGGHKVGSVVLTFDQEG